MIIFFIFKIILFIAWLIWIRDLKMTAHRMFTQLSFHLDSHLPDA